MGALGPKFFSAGQPPSVGLASGVENSLFSFVLSGLSQAYYQPTNLKVWSNTGCRQFLVAIYINGSGGIFSQVDGQWSDPTSGNCNISTIANTVLMQNGTNLYVTVEHFDSGILHGFFAELSGGGFG